MLFRSNNIEYNWTSVEYNKDWYEKISKTTSKDPNLKIQLFDVGNKGLKQQYTNMEEYIKFPKSLNKSFDLVIVDGRKRRRCVLEARDILSESGVVFLHDAQRKYYQCAFIEFNDSVLLLPGLWRGSNKTVSRKRFWKNKVRSICNNLYNVLRTPYIFLKNIVKRMIYAK